MYISDLSTRQVANALVIFAAALPFGADAVKAALMTAAAESSFLRYGNDGSYDRDEKEQIWRWYGRKYGGPNLSLEQARNVYRSHMRESLTFPHDRIAGEALTTKDSVGFFQQRELYGYGSQADLMDPVESTLIFVRGVPGSPMRVRHWMREDKPKNLTIAQTCQWIQGSEFPTGENYAPMEPVAEQLISHFGGIKADPVETEPSNDWITVATKDDVREAFSEANAAVVQQLVAVNQQLGALNQRLQAMVDYQQGILEQQNAMNVRLDALVKNTAKE